MQISLCKKGLYMMTMGRAVKPHQYIEKLKHLDRIDEAFGYMCIHISRELLFHLDGLSTPKEIWDYLESLFEKHDELRGHILENELIALHPSNFKTIQYFFLKIQITRHVKKSIRDCE